MIRKRSYKNPQVGFTLVESLLVMTVFSMMVGFLAWVTIDSGRLANETSTDATMSSAGRTRLDSFINDVRDSSNVLASWTNPGTNTTYVSHLTNDTHVPPTYYATLVLETPSYNSSFIIPTSQQVDGTRRPKYFDHIIYQLEYAYGSPVPTYTLNRMVITDPSSARPSSPDTIVARNVSSGSFTCLVDQAFDGIGTQTLFSLKAPVSTNGGNIVTSATVGGVDQVQPTDMQYDAPTTLYPNGAMDFVTAPAAGTRIDALYSIDCSAANQGLVTGVSFDLMLAVVDPALPVSAQRQTVELSGRANLHNH